MKRLRFATEPAMVVAPLVVLSSAIAALYYWQSASSHESATLLFVLNVFLTSVVSAFIAVLAGKSYLLSGRPTLLAICVGMTIWGASALVSVIGAHVGNYNITIHNLGLLASGLCHLAGAVAGRQRSDYSVYRSAARLTLGIAIGLGVVGLIWMATLEGWLPSFFIDDVGGTGIRTLVLVAAVAAFSSAGMFTAAAYRQSGSRFRLWYAGGLVLIAAGAAGLALQPTHGSWLGWASRSTQYLAGIYMLIGTLLAMREAGGWRISIEERLLVSERLQREQADLIRLINDNTNELIFMKDLRGRLTYANAATARRLDGARLADSPQDRDLFVVPAEHEDISAHDQLVMRTGEVVEAEEVFTSADGVRRTYLSTKSPMRDENGRIVGVIGVSRDITDRISAEAEIRRALDAAEQAGAALRQADLRKDEFLAMLGHELRNPLAPLQNAAEILKTTTAGNLLAEQTVRMIDRQLEHLGRLVDDLIDVSRITRDKIELRNERIDLATIIQEAYDAFLPQARQAGQFMRLALPGVPVSVNGDAVRLAQMLSNLLNNACKYMEAGGTISLSLERVDNEAIVRVRDTGAGIPPDQLSAIFDIFTQVDTTRERSQGGLGIGLTLVKRLAQMHGGDITAHSDGLGRGSEFVLRLPVLPGVTVPAAAEHKAVEAAGPGRRILVVDDNRDAASSLVTLLDILGHMTRVAHDGLEAVHTAEEFSPDVIFLDIGLPGMNGYDVCRCIRRKMPGHKMFIAALTGWGQEDDRAKSRDAGFDTHVVKPIDGRTLTGLLAKLG